MVIVQVSYGYGYTADQQDPTHGYTRTHSLPVRLPLGLLGNIVGLWLWLDVGLWESPVPMQSDSTPTMNVVRSI